MPIPKQTFSVLNTSGHTISGHGVTLQPGLNEGVSVAAFNKAFLGAGGEPTQSAAKHLNPRGDKPPSLLPVTVRAVAKLPQEYALRAVAGAQPEDGRTLQALLETEDRKPVLDAIRARLREMDVPRRPPQAKLPPEPAATPGPMAVLESSAQEPEPAQPKGVMFTGASVPVPEVRDLGGGPRSFQGGPGISATGTEAPANEIQQELSNYVSEPPDPQPTPVTETAPESMPDRAPEIPAAKESPAAQVAQSSQSGRRSRRGGQG